MPTEFWSAILGAIVGAIAGAVPAYILAEKSSREMLKRDAETRKLQKQALTQRVVVKLLTLIDVLGDLKRHIDEEFAKAGTTGRETFEPWQLVLPMSGHSVENVPGFSPDELTVLFGESEYALMQKLMLFQRRCASSYVSFQEFCDRRAVLEASMPIPTKWEGHMAITHLTEEQINKLKQFTIPLNTLILSLREHISQDWQDAAGLAADLTKFAREILEQPTLTIAAPEDDAADGGGK